MASISVSGTDFAAPIEGWGILRLPAMLGLAGLLMAASPTSEIDIRIDGLRNASGMVRLCLTRDPAHFPDCNRDPSAVKRSVATGHAGHVRIAGVSSGTYALAVIHDEDGNGGLTAS